ncbi:MAG: hypothetical protein ABI444_13930 [Candidatus Kapaibacterium sp.]
MLRAQSVTGTHSFAILGRSIVGVMLFLGISLLTPVANAQNRVGIGTVTPVVSALLDLTSTTSGLLIPRLTTIQKLAVATPATGLLVYDLTIGGFYYYDGTVWQPIASGSLAWMLLGNQNIDPNTNFLGTPDAVDFRIRTKNLFRMAVKNTNGYVGMGPAVTNPSWPLEVSQDAPTNIHTAAFRSATSGYGVAIGAHGFVTTYGSVQAYGLGLAQPLALQTVLGGNVGIVDTLPATSLDLQGDMSLRANGFTAATGNNDDISTVLINSYTFVPISGPGGAFAIRGIAGGVDGKILVLFNRTSQNMTLSNDNAGSSAGNRIYTGTGANIVSTGGCCFTLMYSATDNHWILISQVK